MRKTETANRDNYDIVANSVINLRAGKRYMTQTPDPAEAAA